jgi:hypothetical protein
LKINENSPDEDSEAADALIARSGQRASRPNKRTGGHLRGLHRFAEHHPANTSPHLWRPSKPIIAAGPGTRVVVDRVFWLLNAVSE